MSEPLVVQSHQGPYEVVFDDDALPRLDAAVPEHAHVIIDERVADLYASVLPNLLASASVLRLTASERSKSLDRFPAYVEHLVERGVHRGHVLVAIGGGTIQDVVCFLAAVLLRGLEWQFYPTTLLAQADSCIGSKSSINVGPIKNVLGTFTPPARVVIATPLLETLAPEDVRSGVGEMLKVHAIAGPERFDRIAEDYPRLFSNRDVLRGYIRGSLELKRTLVEEDEFDRGARNVMNYGHSFGHAIESATDFGVPHGIAVTIGMDMANYVAVRLGHTSESHYLRMHPTLAANYAGFERTEIPVDRLLTAIAKDKKNRDRALRLVLPDRSGTIAIDSYPNDAGFATACSDYLTSERTR